MIRAPFVMLLFFAASVFIWVPLALLTPLIAMVVISQLILGDRRGVMLAVACIPLGLLSGPILFCVLTYDYLKTGKVFY